MITRRQFLKQSAVAAASTLALDATPAFAGTSGPSIKFPTQPRERIAIASYPFRDFIAKLDAPSGKPGASVMQLEDFPAHVVSKFNIDKVELWTGHFPSTEASYLAHFRNALSAAKAKVVDIAADGEHSPYSADSAEREKAVAFGKQWVDVAAALGSPSIRSNIPSVEGVAPDLDRAAASLSQVAKYAASKNVVVHLENDNPVSEDPFFLVKLVEQVASPWLHTLPDFANTLASSNEEHAYAGIDAMFGKAYGICHVKEFEVNSSGKPVHVDMKRTFGILKAHAYKGYCSMEYDSPGDPYAGTTSLIEQTIRFLS